MFATLFGSSSWLVGAGFASAAEEWLVAVTGAMFVVLVVLFVLAFAAWMVVRYVPNDRAAIVEKLWSAGGSVAEGRIIALGGEAGYQAELLRGGMHFGLWRGQYRVHKARLITISQGKIGYVYARDGEPLSPGQTLGRVVPCNHFQDARQFLNGDGSPNAVRGQRGRQRAILREGVYAINLAMFVVITENKVHSLRHLLDRQEAETIAGWHEELLAVSGFDPIVVGQPMEVGDPLDEETSRQVDGTTIIKMRKRSCGQAAAVVASMCRLPMARILSTAGSRRSR